MSKKLNDLLKEALVRCETEREIKLLRDVLTDTVNGVEEDYLFKYIEDDVKQLLFSLELPFSEDTPRGEFLDKVSKIQEEMVDYCMVPIESELKKRLIRIQRDLMEPDTYGASLLRSLFIYSSTRAYLRHTDLREVIRETLLLLSPMYEKARDKFDKPELTQLLPKKIYLDTETLIEDFILYQNSFVESLIKDPEMYEKAVVGFEFILKSYEKFYKKTLTIN